MISRWDARVDRIARGRYETPPVSIIFHCEGCGSTEFYPLETFPEHWSDPCDVSRRFALQCVRCGLIEVSIIRTILLGAPPARPE